jgi:hypothetical protein
LFASIFFNEIRRFPARLNECGKIIFNPADIREKASDFGYKQKSIAIKMPG